MAIQERRDKAGKLTGYKIVVCLGRDEFYRQVWRSETIKITDARIAGLTPVKQQKEVKAIEHLLAAEWKEQYKEKPEAIRGKKESHTLKSFLQLWIENNRAQWKPQSVGSYQIATGRINAFFGSQIKLGDVDRLKLDSFIADLKGRGLAFRTVKHTLTAFKAAMGYAVEAKMLKENPLQGYKLKNWEEQRETVDFLTPVEAKGFLDVLERDTGRTGSLYWTVFGQLLLFTGLRRGEAQGLQWQDYDAKARQMTVQRSVSTDEHFSKTIVTTTKTKRIRHVPVSELLAATLEKFRAEQLARYGDQLTPESFMFCRPEEPAEPCSVGAPEAWITRLKRRYPELPARLHLHLLRHTSATLSIQSGADLTTVQRILGHSSVSMTEAFYVGTADETKLESANRLEKTITSATDT